MPNHIATFQYLRNPSCVAALFQNNHDDIISLCSFSLLPQSAQSMILPLDELHILIMNVYNITRICDDIESVLLGCSQCIYELLCTCTLHTNSTYITPHVRNCIRDDQILNRTLLPKTHVKNLAVLAS